MNKYLRLIEELEKDGTGKMKCFGKSMTPIIESGSLLTFVKLDQYDIGDIVFCRVNGRFIDAHKVTKIDAEKRYMIANNKGYENGWTKVIYGKVIKSECEGKIKNF